MSPTIVAFAVSTLGIAYISRASLLHPSSHGFYRFFAWEAILAMILLTLRRWFDDPYSLHQMISWPLLIISALLAIQGAYTLHARGQQNATRQDRQLMDFEKTTTVVATGLYKYIRHPLYGSLLFLAWGVFFKNLTWTTSVLVVLATACLTATAKVEEVENVRYFGPDYRAYMGRTKMFVPFLF